MPVTAIVWWKEDKSDTLYVCEEHAHAIEFSEIADSECEGLIERLKSEGVAR